MQPGGVDASTFVERRGSQSAGAVLRAGATIVVTGGAGFIGSHLCERLLQDRCHVTVLDDLRSGNAANLPHDAQLHFEQLCIGTPSAAARLAAHVAHADFVFHLASPVGVSLAHFEPAATAASIVSAGVQVVEACRVHQRPLLFTSSSEVYGATPTCPTAEDAPLTLSNAPRFSYGTAKLIVEQLVAGLFRHGVPSWTVRLFNVVGPRQRPGAGVVASFVDCALNDRPLTIHGDGCQTRCFLHVADAVEALAATALNRSLCGRAINVGSDVAVTINDVAATVAEQLGRHCTIRRAGYAEVFGGHFIDVRWRIPDTRLLTEATGWRPRFTLHDIVRDCLADRAAEKRKLA